MNEPEIVPNKELRDEIVCYFDNDDDPSLSKDLSNVEIIDSIGQRLSERHREWVLTNEDGAS